MEHQAFLFDWNSFAKELSALLDNSLKTDNREMLIVFIKTMLNHLKDPYTGELLGSTWQDTLEIKDVHHYGLLALTKYYDPFHNIGLGYNWIRIQDLLENANIESALVSSIVLGEPFGPEDNYFDPGKMGTYFQSEKQVNQNLQKLHKIAKQNPHLSNALEDLLQMLTLATESHQGLVIIIV